MRVHIDKIAEVAEMAAKYQKLRHALKALGEAVCGDQTMTVKALGIECPVDGGELYELVKKERARLGERLHDLGVEL